MGTLQEQAPRQEHLMGYVSSIRGTLHEMYPDRVSRYYTREEWTAAAEVTKVALAIQSADVFDEQLAGFGEILEHIACSIETMSLSDG